ncbi:MAG: GTP pyrophosphokinase family protein [Peptococcaceae bacterium]|nr:GTP pyrophosphokinase family protein [Peptococcaceae bacterium]
MTNISNSLHIDDRTLNKVEVLDDKANPIKALRRSEAFKYVMMEYQVALKIVETKLDALDSEFNLRHDRNPIESISTRLKTPESIVEKMHRRGLPISVENIQKSLTDISGARVICSFLDDIYILADMIEGQEDISILAKKDYIAHPKENGYRSLHLIVSIPIYLSQGRKDIPVEIQFRTIAMEFWATLEHKIKYKKKIADPESVSAELKSCADLINEIDHRMQSLRRRTIDEPF